MIKHKALTITLLLNGIFVMGLYSLKLSHTVALQAEILYEVDLDELELPEETPEDVTEAEKPEIETHQAVNVAEERTAPSPSKTRSIDEQILDELEKERAEAEEEAKESAEDSREIAMSDDKKPEKISPRTPKKYEFRDLDKESANPDATSTNYYNLPGRTARHFPNPVYTCSGSGKIVVNVAVDSHGRVIEADLNKGASTTQNGCLIDKALAYARDALFSKDSREQQAGTITYVFPGH